MSRVALLGLPEDLENQLTRILLEESHQVSRKLYISDLGRGPNAGLVFISGDSPGYQQTLSAVRETHPGLPVILVSRRSDAKQWLDALDAGATDYCGAPFEREQVRWIVNSAVNRARPHVKTSSQPREAPAEVLENAVGSG